MRFICINGDVIIIQKYCCEDCDKFWFYTLKLPYKSYLHIQISFHDCHRPKLKVIKMNRFEKQYFFKFYGGHPIQDEREVT